MDFSESHYGPTTRQLHATFTDEIASLGGFVSDEYDDGARLFMRAVLPMADDVGPGDTVRGGIAMRVTGPEIAIHPYTLRQVCTNGAIAACATQSVGLERVQHDGIVVPAYDVAAIIARVTVAIHDCAAPDAFTQSIGDMRFAQQVSANMAIHFAQIASRLPQQVAEAMIRRIFGRWTHGDDSSAFGLMNAITSVARDTSDPEARWMLEEAGGSVAARIRAPKIDVPTSVAV